jgi:DNA-binding NarL/FixJ family response regulator
MKIMLAASCENIGSVYQRFLLEYENVEEVLVADSIETCIDVFRNHRVDLTAVSVELLKHMPRADAMLTASKVHRPKKVVMTPEVSGRLVLEAISYGFNDVIGLSHSAEEIMTRIQMVMNGETDISQLSYVQGIRDLVGEDNKSRFANDDVDLRILLQLAYGHSNKEISEAVYLSLQTVRNRISRLMQVTKAQNRTQLALMFLQE